MRFHVTLLCSLFLIGCQSNRWECRNVFRSETVTLNDSFRMDNAKVTLLQTDVLSKTATFRVENRATGQQWVATIAQSKSLPLATPDSPGIGPGLVGIETNRATLIWPVDDCD
jgi:hypothetical protein